MEGKLQGDVFLLSKKFKYGIIYMRFVSILTKDRIRGKRITHVFLGNLDWRKYNEK